MSNNDGENNSVVDVWTDPNHLAADYTERQGSRVTAALSRTVTGGSLSCPKANDSGNDTYDLTFVQAATLEAQLGIDIRSIGWQITGHPFSQTLPSGHHPLSDECDRRHGLGERRGLLERITGAFVVPTR